MNPNFPQMLLFLGHYSSLQRHKHYSQPRTNPLRPCPNSWSPNGPPGSTKRAGSKPGAVPPTDVDVAYLKPYGMQPQQQQQHHHHHQGPRCQAKTFRCGGLTYSTSLGRTLLKIFRKIRSSFATPHIVYALFYFMQWHDGISCVSSGLLVLRTSTWHLGAVFLTIQYSTCTIRYTTPCEHFFFHASIDQGITDDVIKEPNHSASTITTRLFTIHPCVHVPAHALVSVCGMGKNEISRKKRRVTSPLATRPSIWIDDRPSLTPVLGLWGPLFVLSTRPKTKRNKHPAGPFA
ncbi:hypothetical protein BC826DRAFT_440300 [Russula brevipes]|nr:hypothetical protein BC826DRAFT_440300 [Russula brevipes]